MSDEVETTEEALGEPAPDERLWEPDGPTYAQITEWKNRYGDVYVTSVTPEKHYVWRTLTRPEYRTLVKQLEQMVGDGITQADANLNNEEGVAELCILAPSYSRGDVKHMAGVASLISQEIMEASAFTALEVRSL